MKVSFTGKMIEFEDKSVVKLPKGFLEKNNLKVGDWVDITFQKASKKKNLSK